jgi:hypothetical protein
VVKTWARARRRWTVSKGGRRDLGAIQAMRQTIGAHIVLYFPRIIQTGSKLKIENGCLTVLQNFLHVASLGYYEQFSQLC